MKCPSCCLYRKEIIKHSEGINPSILIDSLEEEIVETDNFITDNDNETNDYEIESSEVKISYNPSMLNIACQHLQTYKMPSTASRFSWRGESALRGITCISSLVNKYGLFFKSWIVFILGLMVGGFMVNFFLCDSFDNKQNTTDSSRRHPG